MLTEEFRRTGDWLFRWRSYLPVAFLVIAIPAVRDTASRGGAAPAFTAWDLMALLVALLGLGIRFYTVGHAPAGTSGRNTLGQVADSLNVTGLYSVVRHPLYLGNFLMWLGVSLVPRCWWFTALTVLIFWLYYERIMFAEEGFLEERFGEDYRRWAAATPAFVPQFRDWVKPALPFSLKSAIAREYSSLFAVIAVFTFFQAMRGWFARGTLAPDPWTAALFAVGLALYVSVRYLKKNTRVLRAEGR
jgi:protein-S-isoprenylcysteine O-methyltransferase Ste14